MVLVARAFLGRVVLAVLAVHFEVGTLANDVHEHAAEHRRRAGNVLDALRTTAQARRLVVLLLDVLHGGLSLLLARVHRRWILELLCVCVRGCVKLL